MSKVSTLIRSLICKFCAYPLYLILILSNIEYLNDIKEQLLVPFHAITSSGEHLTIS